MFCISFCCINKFKLNYSLIKTNTKHPSMSMSQQNHKAICINSENYMKQKILPGKCRQVFRKCRHLRKMRVGAPEMFPPQGSDGRCSGRVRTFCLARYVRHVEIKTYSLSVKHILSVNLISIKGIQN